MMLRAGGVTLIILLGQIFMNAAAASGTACHLLEPRIFQQITHNGPDESGSGRDGGVGGTGIVAEISGTSPLRLAGCAVDIRPDTKIIDDKKPMNADKLEQGQVVYALLTPKGGRLQATSIVVQHLLEGPVTAIPGSARLEVMGQPVAMAGGQAPLSPASSRLAVGNGVKVSGFRMPDGAVIASRIEVFDHLKEVGTAGILEQNATSYRIGGIEVTGSPDPAWIGYPVSAIGHWSGGRIEAAKFHAVGIGKETALPRWVLVESVARKNGNGQISLVDVPSRFETCAAQEGLNLADGERVIVFGPTSPDGTVNVRKVWKK